MYNIKCDFCGEEISFENPTDKPDSCSNCFQPFDQVETQQKPEQNEFSETAANHDMPHREMFLIYQKTGAKISIPDHPRTVLGREACGEQVLGNIPQISRNHCLVECENNEFKLSDLDSLNGTFAGISKTDCNKKPKYILTDNDLVFLGKEPFLVKIQSVDAVLDAEDGPQPGNKNEQETRSKASVVRCLNCGAEFPNQEIILNSPCEECHTYGEWEEI